MSSRSLKTKITKYFWVTVCKAVRPMLSDCCLSVLSCPVCLSVTLVYCGETVGWIKVPLGTQIGLSPGNSVLDEDPASPPKRHSPPFFGRRLLWPNGWIKMPLGMEVGLCSIHIVLGGDPAPPRKGHSSPPTFVVYGFAWSV